MGQNLCYCICPFEGFQIQCSPFLLFFSVLICLFNVFVTLHSAIRFCFDEKTIYTQEVLAIVLQQLMEINPLPTLFMRTVGNVSQSSKSNCCHSYTHSLTHSQFLIYYTGNPVAKYLPKTYRIRHEFVIKAHH